MKLLKFETYCGNCEKLLKHKLTTTRTHICYECATNKEIFICKADAGRLLLELNDKQKYYYGTYALYKIRDFEADNIILFFS